MKNIALRVFAIILLGVAMGMTSTAHAGKVETNDPIKLPIMQSSDFDFVISVFGEVLKEAGYRVEYVNADYSASFTGVKLGDLHATVGWETTPEQIEDAMNSGKALNLGSTGVEIDEGWWFPAITKEACPGLPDWEALKQPGCVEALSTAETAPMARFVGVPSGWVANTEERIEAFDLEFENVPTGSPVAMAATIQGAVDRGEPIIGWGYVPHWLTANNEGEFVKFPAYEAECYSDPSWGVNPDKSFDCGFNAGYIWKIMNKDAFDSLPYARRIFYLLQLDSTAVGEGMSRIDNDGVSLVDAAREWMASHEDDWQAWIR